MAERMFSQVLDVLLEDAELFGPAVEALQQLDNAKGAVREAELALRQQIDVLNNQLALQIRRNNPNLVVALTRDNTCTVRYRNYNNSLNLKADPKQRIFGVGDTPFERTFTRYHGHTLALGVDILAKAVADFFKQNYRSIK